MLKQTASALALAAFLTGCSLTPELRTPEANIASGYPTGAYDAKAPAAGARLAVDTGWREFFPDPRLQALIESALEHNADLRLAVLNVDAARAAYGITRSERLPSVNADGSFTRTRVPETVSPTGRDMTTSEYSVGVGAAFELDFFGRVKSLSDAALAQYLATEEAARSAQIAIVAAVANAYLGERALDEQLALSRSTLAAREDSYKLAEQRYRAGAASALDLRQQETALESARVATAQLARQRAQAANALSLLVGQPLQGLPQGQPLAEQGIVADIPAGLPSELLAQRPDIRAAEQRLVGANANIGAARAAFFPRISLTGAVGTLSGDLDDLFGSGSGMWSFMPQISLPIFSGGRNRANLELAEVHKEQAIVEYELAIRTAFREVADALVARGALTEQAESQARLLAAQAERFELAEQRYRAGVASYLEVLDAQRELFAAEQGMVQTRQLALSNAVDLYRALGGGLREHNAEVAAR